MSAYQAAPGQPGPQGPGQAGRPGPHPGDRRTDPRDLPERRRPDLSIVARRKSSKAGYSNGIALAGIIVGIVTTIATIIIVAVIIYSAGVAGDLLSACQGHAGQPITFKGQQVTCPATS